MKHVSSIVLEPDLVTKTNPPIGITFYLSSFSSVYVQNMRKIKALTTAEMCHHVMRALGRLGCIREMLFAYKYMLQDGIKPTIHTYHVIVDEYLREGSDSSLERGAYELWRLLVKDLSAKQVDVGLLNKLIKCCRLSGNHERAFFFLQVINEYNLQMDVETFEELLKVGSFTITINILQCR